MGSRFPGADGDRNSPSSIAGVWVTRWLTIGWLWPFSSPRSRVRIDSVLDWSRLTAGRDNGLGDPRRHSECVLDRCIWQASKVVQSSESSKL